MTAMIRPPTGINAAEVEAAIQAAIDPIAVHTVSGGAIATHTFSNLAGVSVVRLELEWVKGALSNSAVLIRPNGITTNQLTDYSQGDGGASPGDLSIAGLVLCVCNRGPGAHGITTLSLATGRQRTGVVLFGGGGDPATPTSNRNCHGYLLWNDTSTAITSLQIDCVNAGTLLAASDLLDGTTISLFRVR